MKTENFKTMVLFTLGQKVICNGNAGEIKEICVGQLSGMYVIRLDAGEVCVSGQDVKADDK